MFYLSSFYKITQCLKINNKYLISRYRSTSAILPIFMYLIKNWKWDIFGDFSNTVWILSRRQIVKAHDTFSDTNISPCWYQFLVSRTKKCPIVPSGHKLVMHRLNKEVRNPIVVLQLIVSWQLFFPVFFSDTLAVDSSRRDEEGEDELRGL